MKKVDYLELIRKFQEKDEEVHAPRTAQPCTPYTATAKRHNRDLEHKVQTACVRWFNMQYVELQGLLFAIPNGGRRDRVTAAKLKAEGVVAGVADLMLAMPCGEKHGLFIEMKTEEKQSRQRQSQKDWERKVKDEGYEYRVCRSLDDFMGIVNAWIGRR